MENKINQYLDKDDGMYHITFYQFIGSVLVRNTLNYRIYSVELTDGTIVRDPEFSNAKYVFKIHTDFLSKNIFFNARFLVDDIKNVKSFKFGLCDEKVTWHKNHFLDIKNDLAFNDIQPELDLSNESYIYETNTDNHSGGHPLISLDEKIIDTKNNIISVNTNDSVLTIEALPSDNIVATSAISNDEELDIKQVSMRSNDFITEVKSELSTTTSVKKSWKKSKK